MSQQHPQVPVLDLSGSPMQMGQAHGEAFRDGIREHVERFLGWLLDLTPLALTEEDLWLRWAPQAGFNERAAPALVEEMHGIARGAGVPFERIFLLNSLLDLDAFQHLELAAGLPGCTAFAVAADADEGKTLLGQTYDLPAFQGKQQAILRLAPLHGPRQLVFTLAGVVGLAGLNEMGLAVNLTHLGARDVGLGLLQTLTVRQVLAGTHLADALAPPLTPPRASGAFFLLADADGHVVGIETTARRHEVLFPEKDTLGHTNHYLTSLRSFELIRPQALGGSLARYTILRRFLGDHARLTLDALFELTRNHASYPRSICDHGEEAASDNPVQTIASLIQVPADRILHHAAGSPCESELHPVSL